MKKDDKHRQHATIESVRPPYIEDHGILTTNVGLNLTSGFHQGFGGLCLDPKTAKDYVEQLCKTFGVKDMKDLVGKKCYALYSFTGWNENIEGLESADTGRRFLHNQWRKKHFPKFGSLLKERQQEIKNRIARHKDRIEKDNKELDNLVDDYVDWEKM